VSACADLGAKQANFQPRKVRHAYKPHPWLDGVTPAEQMRRGRRRLPVTSAARIFIQLPDALRYELARARR
jgi:hypothetical protein